MSAPKEVNERELARRRAMKPVARFGDGYGGYTPTPHSFYTIVARKCSGWAQHFLIGYIMDRTFGVKGGKADWTKLSLPVLARLTGLTTSAFWLAIEDAVKRGLIEREESGKSWVYRTTPETWHLAEDWSPKAKAPETDAPETDAPETDAPETDAPETDAPETDAPETDAPHSSVVVASGKSAKPIVLSVEIKGLEKKVDMRFQPRNDSDHALRFETSVSRAGLVQFTVRNSEQTAKSFEVQFKTSSPTTDKNHRLSEIRAALKPVFDKNWQTKLIDELFVQRLAAALGKSAPIPTYITFVEEEIAEMRRRRRPVVTGILEYLANSYRAKWDADAGERRALELARREVERAKASDEAEIARLAPLRAAIDRRVGNSIDEFRRLSGIRKQHDDDDRVFDAWVAAEAAVYREFGEPLPCHLAASRAS